MPIPGKRMVDGSPVMYNAPVVPADSYGNESDISPLVGLDDMAQMNVYLGRSSGASRWSPTDKGRK